MAPNDKIKLIAKFLSGNASAEEEKELSDWLKENPANEHLFNQAKKIWIVSANLKEEYSPDTEKEWEKLKTKIESTGLGSKVIPIPRRNWLTIAAAILAITVLGFVLKYMLSGDGTQSDKNIQLVEVISADSVNIFYLPDSSKIFLNKNSSISFAKDFADTARMTYLIGEAYFEVTKSDKPFIVYAGGTQVRVMGTSFNVKANEEDEDVEIVVVEGKVSFKEQDASNSSEILLEKDDKVTFNKTNKEYKKEKNTDKGWWEKLNLEKEVNKLWNKVKKEFRKK